MVKNSSDTHIIMRDQYGWKVLHKGGIKLWFCGYLYGISIENFLDKASQIVSGNIESNAILNWIKNINGHFAFVIECNSVTIASVDKICSIPLFFNNNNGDILISNHAPILRRECKLDDSKLDEKAKLEIAMSGYTIASKTLYGEIERLESGECIFLNNNNYYREYYYTYSPWKIVDKTKSQLQNEFLNICLETFRKIKDNLGGRQIVVPLSAGNDSRLIASGLKEVGVKNVVCFSYGRRGNFETPISKAIASKLGYRWVYIPDRLKDKRRFFQSKVYREYIDAFESFSYTHNVQEVYEVFMLKKSNLVDDDAVFINGSCGDFISGGHIRPTSDIKHVSKFTGEICWKKFLDKHYSLWSNLRTPANDAYIISELEKKLLLRIKETVDFGKYNYAAMESAEFIGRQSKMVMGQQRIYEFFGYEWRMPLWSNEMLSFWESVPYQYKVDQRLYLETLYESNWGNVWQDIKVNDKVVNPAALRWLRTLLKILFIPLGRSRWHRFEKNVLEYFMHPSYSLTVASYLSILFDRKGHRGTYSWLSRQMIQSKKYKQV